MAKASTGDRPSVATSTAAHRQASSASAVANGSAHDASAAARSSADAMSSCRFRFRVLRDYSYVGNLRRESYVGLFLAGTLQHESYMHFYKQSATACDVAGAARVQGSDQRILDMQRVPLERRVAPLQRCVGVARLALHLHASNIGRFIESQQQHIGARRLYSPSRAVHFGWAVLNWWSSDSRQYIAPW